MTICTVCLGVTKNFRVYKYSSTQPPKRRIIKSKRNNSNCLQNFSVQLVVWTNYLFSKRVNSKPGFYTWHQLSHWDCSMKLSTIYCGNSHMQFGCCWKATSTWSNAISYWFLHRVGRPRSSRANFQFTLTASSNMASTKLWPIVDSWKIDRCREKEEEVRKTKKIVCFFLYDFFSIWSFLFLFNCQNWSLSFSSIVQEIVVRLVTFDEKKISS